MIKVRARVDVRSWFRLLASALLMAGALPSWADHALLQDGRGLFNVLVDNTATTWSRPLRVRYNQYSFGYDYDRHSVFALLSQFGDYYDVADFVQTTGTVGKFGARQLMVDRQWHRYVPPPPVIIPIFTPAPPTPVPTAAPVVEPIDPTELADPSLPIDKKVEAQLNLFIQAQSEMANKIKFSVSIKTINDDAGRRLRVELLQHQLKILTNAYPATENRVQKAKEALEHQIQLVKETGRFSHED